MGDPSGDQDFSSVPFRARQRQAKIAARLAMPDAEHARASAVIEAHLAQLLMPLPPQVVAFCWPVRKEFDCRPLVGRLIDAGWRACQPVVVAAASPMAFRSWMPGAPMATDRHGIPVPDNDDAETPAVVLLPLVAFDERGYRLGYGGGYFDRTLAAMTPRPLAVGVGFELARLDSVRPETHDVRLDFVVTETGIRQTGRSACFPTCSER